MAETQTAPATGTFVWNELTTSNVAKATEFYTKLFGWRTREMDMAQGGKYTIFVNEGKDIGGCMKSTPEMGNAPPHWGPYVGVTNVDATAKQVMALGGKVHVPPTDIPNVGRFAVIADPTGAVISLLTPKS